MKVACSVSRVCLTNDNGIEVDGVEVTCSRCGHSEESYGTSERSINRCMVLLKKRCSESNFYFDEDEGAG